MSHAPIRLVGHSPYAKYRDAHPPRPVEPGARGSSIGIALLLAALVAGAGVGIVFTNYWREIVTVALLTFVSVACGLAIQRADRRAR
jgi:hypothetical protein